MGVGVGVTVGDVGGVVELVIELLVRVALLLRFAKVIPPYPTTMAARRVSVAILRNASGGVVAVGLTLASRVGG